MRRAQSKLAVYVAFLSASVCPLASFTAAQSSAKATVQHPTPRSTKRTAGSHASRLLTRDEGLAVIGAALDTRDDSRGDCSHIVHSIYKEAGFPYRYADSSELYAGVAGFRKIVHPQPGDLAVWRGHAAIVVNPAQHSFFGTTRSGLRVESYDLGYWKRRGAPRFFRYVKVAAKSSRSANTTTTAKLAVESKGRTSKP